MGRTPRRRLRYRPSRYAATLVAASLLLTACGASTAPTRGTRPSSTSAKRVVRVPQDVATIQAAVAQAQPGGIVLISPGVYHESVQVDRPRVTLRGLDRNRVILDEDVLRPNGVVLTGAGDAVQNLTVRHATLNGVLVTGETGGDGSGIGKGSDGYSPDDQSRFPPVDGFLVDHVTSYDNGLYGVYAFDATNGTIENSYTSGMADSGLYVGQCKPCHIAVHDNVAERNAVGYEGTNASGDMTVYGNRFVGNRVGATTDSDHQEGLLPQSGATMVGNVIAANDQKQTPEQADGGFGIGVGIAGGTHNLVTRNLITANPVAGLEITNFDDLPPIQNRVEHNRITDNGVDVVYAASAAQPGRGNCLAGNTATSIRPATLPRNCPADNSRITGVTAPATNAPRGIPFTDVTPPPTQPGLPSPATSPAPTVGAPSVIDVGRVAVPSAGLLQADSDIRW